MKNIKTINQLLKEISTINIRNEKKEIKNPYYDKIISILKNFKIVELNYSEIKSHILDLNQSLRDDKNIDTNKEFMSILEKNNIVIKFLDEQQKNNIVCFDWNLILDFKLENENITNNNTLVQEREIIETTPLLQENVININNESIPYGEPVKECCPWYCTIL